MDALPTTRTTLRTHVAAAAGTAICYFLFYTINEWLFRQTEFTEGIAWIYLPAGVRLICTLLFAEAGCVGLLVGSTLTAATYRLFPHDPITTAGYCLISAAAPYIAYRFTLSGMDLRRSLANLTSTRLMACILLYALTNPLFQLLWFVMRGVSPHFWSGLVVMSIGDLCGSILVVYLFRFLLSLLPLPRR
ncbi:hypothetical protein J8I26_10620 [Herbaspirillum sp. LeCh32-8]|uniref:hypothetical protein n=1 Tax=Herbaspirillum sp. LeCh32-8 TaxID=2821356 RepID=UPI001AE3A940|nr:hypothetical protein [Herbaspirillum sp. LeCh32-8]MBP0598559.1 hypothetical protein [Herbaspirillum sp. LeCh32-8]